MIFFGWTIYFTVVVAMMMMMVVSPSQIVLVVGKPSNDVTG